MYRFVHSNIPFYEYFLYQVSEKNRRYNLQERGTLEVQFIHSRPAIPYPLLVLKLQCEYCTSGEREWEDSWRQTNFRHVHFHILCRERNGKGRGAPLIIFFTRCSLFYKIFPFNFLLVVIACSGTILSLSFIMMNAFWAETFACL